MKNKQGIDWSKKDLYEGIGRPDLKPENVAELNKYISWCVKEGYLDEDTAQEMTIKDKYDYRERADFQANSRE